MAESAGFAAGGGHSHPEPPWVPRTTVPVNALTRYLRLQLEVTGGVMRWEVPRTFLGLVPLGVRRVAVPVGEVRSVRVRLGAHPLRLFVGVACLALPLVSALRWGGGWWGVVPLAVAGAWMVAVSVSLHLEAAVGGGRRVRSGICLFHRIDAELYAAAVNDLVAGAQGRIPGRPVG